ncbi:uncharacterized protein LOC121637109 [Melanotaenia boesemani]|uniref:uncharacterized protein LOC121637109 n=1 Tax=Melanotaenia boesemani TaxID=1250792 RepID=UPI001C049501|nr:uncharacterized protein LOC121637109 [Melanotaenia boesemani]
MAGRGHNTFNVFTPVMARGRVLFNPDSLIQVRGPVTNSGGLLESDDVPPLEPQFSTPVANNESTIQQLRDLIGELGDQIGESVASRLLASQSQLTSEKPSVTKPVKVEASDATVDFSKMSLVVRPDIKEPPMYRGDGDDKCSVQEWIEMMELYLQKKGSSAEEQRDEVLGHLLGRAKSIVKIGLKSCPSVNPEVIYGILRRYFSETPGSCLPLADFYATQPITNESPVDYWVRLNAAADVADRHLENRGNRMSQMDAEVAMMFIRNCPDPNLACVFKCKPISKWTLAEVQEAIDEHQREHRVKKPAANTAKPRVLQMATAVPVITSPEPEIDQVHVNTAKTSAASPPLSNDATASEPNALERVLSMLERVLERTNQPVHSSNPHHLSPARFTPCQVCDGGATPYQIPLGLSN